MNKTKISYLISHPIQYFAPLFRQLAQAECVELIVYYCSNPGNISLVDEGFGKSVTWDIPLLDGYDSDFLHNLSRSKSLDNKFWGLINLDIIRKLYCDKSDIVIVHGWSYFTNHIAIFTAWLLGKRVWLRGENPFNQEITKPLWLRYIKKMILKFWLFRFVDRFLYIGTQNKKFYSYYGVPDHKLIYAPYCVDNVFFEEQARRLPAKNVLRAEFELPIDATIILFSGKYITKKNPLDLLKAYARIGQNKIALVMVGEGRLRDQMEEFSRQNQLDNLFLTGFINQREISKYYALADIFVLPSGGGETWGLVVNEAMLFGLPVIVSDTVGSSMDLVKHGENGFIFTEGNIDQLTNCLSLLINDEHLRMRAGARSKELIKKFTYSVMIENIVKHLTIRK